MNILVITNRYPNPEKPYAGKFVQRHVALHQQMGFQMHVLAPYTHQTGLKPTLLKYGYLLWQLCVYLWHHSPDLIHAHWELPSGLLAVLASKWKRVPVLVTSHGAYTAHFEQRPRWLRGLIRWVWQQAQAVIVVGQAQAETITQQTQRTNIHCVHMGVWLPPTPTPQPIAQEQLAISPDPPVLIFVGNLAHHKGVDILLQALSQITESYQAYVVGSGADSTAWQQQAQKLGLPVHFVGAVLPEMVHVWLSAGDVCVIPSRREAFGLVALEAMGARTAVVASAIGGLQQTIQDGVNGYLVPSEDPHALAGKLQQLLRDASLREAVIEAGWQTAQQNHMGQQAHLIANLYHQLHTREYER